MRRGRIPARCSPGQDVVVHQRQREQPSPVQPSQVDLIAEDERGVGDAVLPQQKRRLRAEGKVGAWDVQHRDEGGFGGHGGLRGGGGSAPSEASPEPPGRPAARRQPHLRQEIRQGQGGHGGVQVAGLVAHHHVHLLATLDVLLPDSEMSALSGHICPPKGPEGQNSVHTEPFVASANSSTPRSSSQGGHAKRESRAGLLCGSKAPQ